MSDLEKSILATLSYYDIFDYPLTSFEIWKYLVNCDQFKKREINLGDVASSLMTSEVLSEKLSHKYGFYFFKEREGIVNFRLERKKRADQTWKKMRKIFKILNVVPFVRGIFISGSLAMENSKSDSDIDVIVVAKRGRIWTVRTFITIITSILGVRRNGSKTKDRICLNHYITDESLTIPFESIYNAESYVHLVNVYKEDEPTFLEFQKANLWIKDYVRGYEKSELLVNRSISKNNFFVFISKIFEIIFSSKIGDSFENVFSKIEGSRIRKSHFFKKAGGRITIDDTQLEFHPDSHENFIIPEFNSRMRDLSLFEFANQKDSGLNR